MSLTISEFFKLTKPGVLYLLMITAGASMILATNFNLDIIKALTGFLGIACNRVCKFSFYSWICFDFVL